MPTLALSDAECRLASDALKLMALELKAYMDANPGSPLLPEWGARRDASMALARRMQEAAEEAKRPAAARRHAPAAVDTFPVCAEGDGEERCVVGADKHPGCWDERLDPARRPGETAQQHRARLAGMP